MTVFIFVSFITRKMNYLFMSLLAFSVSSRLLFRLCAHFPIGLSFFVLIRRTQALYIIGFNPLLVFVDVCSWSAICLLTLPCKESETIILSVVKAVGLKRILHLTFRKASRLWRYFFVFPNILMTFTFGSCNAIKFVCILCELEMNFCSSNKIANCPRDVY